MSFFSVSTYNFRNLKNTQINTNAKNIFLIGENGHGKTNFLEAVYVLCFGNSFRTKIDSLFVKEDEKEMSVKGIYDDEKKESDTAVALSTKQNPPQIDGDGWRPEQCGVKNSILLSIVRGKKT
ncbi:MAG: AAA family ATPase, partial [Spirochaetaceae bacterium]|nr:AAA family ATPase [Spirochaetaceae bacterium]